MEYPPEHKEPRIPAIPGKNRARETVPHLAPTAVHATRDIPCTIGFDKSVSTRFRPPTKTDVFDELLANRFVPSDRLVHGAVKRNQLPDSCRASRMFDISNAEFWQIPDDRQREKRNTQPLAPRLGNLRRPDRQHVSGVSFA
jgi:hypothetical protein